MEPRRFMNTSLPQTLQFGVLLLYFNALFNLLSGLGAFFIPLIAAAIAQAAGGYGIANEKKWGYWSGVAGSILVLAILFVLITANEVRLGGFQFISIIADIALVVLLVHPQSREYQRIWFK